MEILKIHNISKSFKNIKAVNNVSFVVNQGDILGLLGTNGAGKSTTISIICTLLKADSGDILYKGQSITNNPKCIQQELGYVPQDIALYPSLTGYENLKFWAEAYGLKGNLLKERISEISEIIGIKKRLEDRVGQYSGGMKRRLNIGVALLHNPKIVIMDEATVGIDPQSRNHILESVKILNQKGTTIIYTSHYIQEIEKICNKICIMNKGNLIAYGTQQEILNLIKKKEIVNLEQAFLEIIGRELQD